MWCKRISTISLFRSTLLPLYIIVSFLRVRSIYLRPLLTCHMHSIHFPLISSLSNLTKSPNTYQQHGTHPSKLVLLCYSATLFCRNVLTSTSLTSERPPRPTSDAKGRSSIPFPTFPFPTFPILFSTQLLPVVVGFRMDPMYDVYISVTFCTVLLGNEMC